MKENEGGAHLKSMVRSISIKDFPCQWDLVENERYQEICTNKYKLKHKKQRLFHGVMYETWEIRIEPMTMRDP